MDLILVRHSRPRIDENTPPPDWELSQEGRALASRLADALVPLQPDAIFTSDEPKALQTAEAIAARLGLRPTTVRALREHDRKGEPFLRSDGEFQRRLRELFDRPAERVYGRESAEEALRRFEAAVQHITDEPSIARPVVVTHATVLALYLASRTRRSAPDIWKQLTMPCYVFLQTSVTDRDPEIHTV
ncbi:MAG: histidine phosphatase family protein [Longimicrobiales bacterium]